MPESTQSCFCFLHLFCIYLLSVFPLHLSDYIQRYFTPVHLVVCIFLQKNLSALIYISIVVMVYIFSPLTFLFFFPVTSQYLIRFWEIQTITSILYGKDFVPSLIEKVSSNFCQLQRYKYLVLWKYCFISMKIMWEKKPKC